MSRISPSCAAAVPVLLAVFLMLRKSPIPEDSGKIAVSKVQVIPPVIGEFRDWTEVRKAGKTRCGAANPPVGGPASPGGNPITPQKWSGSPASQQHQHAESAQQRGAGLGDRGVGEVELGVAYRWSKDLVTFRGHGQTDGTSTTVNFNAVTNAGVTTVTATVTGTSTSKLFVDVKVTQN